MIVTNKGYYFNQEMKLTILIVDDEDDILTLLKYNLEKSGFRVISAQDGPEAVNTAKKERPD